MLASPALFFSTAVRAGYCPRLVPPFSESAKARLEFQLAALGQLEAALQRGRLRRSESSEPLTVLGSQLVGLRVKPGLSRRIETERMSRGMPCRMLGIGSETAVIWALPG